MNIRYQTMDAEIRIGTLNNIVFTSSVEYISLGFLSYNCGSYGGFVASSSWVQSSLLSHSSKLAPEVNIGFINALVIRRNRNWIVRFSASCVRRSCSDHVDRSVSAILCTLWCKGQRRCVAWFASLSVLHLAAGDILNRKSEIGAHVLSGYAHAHACRQG